MGMQLWRGGKRASETDLPLTKWCYAEKKMMSYYEFEEFFGESAGRDLWLDAPRIEPKKIVSTSPEPEGSSEEDANSSEGSSEMDATSEKDDWGSDRPSVDSEGNVTEGAEDRYEARCESRRTAVSPTPTADHTV